jgi:prevent-host-death family protein
MAKHVGIFEAKTRLSSLIEEVERGDDVVITRHGKPVARLVRERRHYTPEEVAHRRKAWEELGEIGRRLRSDTARAQSKAGIDEERR